MNLTATASQDYINPVASMLHGISLLNNERHSRISCGFFVRSVQLPFMAGWARHPQGWPVLVPVRLTSLSPSPFTISLVRDGFITFLRDIIMNTKSQVAPEFRPHVAVIDGQIKTTSLKIAEHFGKRHDTVLRSIKNLDCSDDFRRRNFAEASYEVEQPKGGVAKYSLCEMTRDGFTFLTMGFTGKQAAQWKEAYITAFNAMERELLQNQPLGNTEQLPAPSMPLDGRILLTIRNGQIVSSEPLPERAKLFTPNDAPSIRSWVFNYIPAQHLHIVMEAVTERSLAISSSMTERLPVKR